MTMARTTNPVFRTALQHFVFALAVTCLSITGCGERPSAGEASLNRSMVPSAGLPTTEQPQEEAKQEEKKATPEEKNKAKQATNNGDSADKKAASAERTSRLDAAIKELNAKEPIDLNTALPVPDREVHESLLPLVEKHWIRLHPGYEVWLDIKGKQVFVGGRISIHEGMLEMFACPMKTKDHESIVATISNAEIIHAGLLASGAIAGRPTRWMPEFVPAFGPKCEMKLIWQDDEGRHDMRAQELIIDLMTDKSLESDWVFCGSKVWTNPEDASQREYFADQGELISISNFPTSMIDLNIESSDANAGLRFQANNEKIPAPGTPVLICIKPDLSTNPTTKQLSDADILIAKAEKQLEEEYQQARKERKARMKKQREEAEKRKAELQAEENDR